MVRPPKVGPELPRGAPRPPRVFMHPAGGTAEVLDQVLMDWYRGAREEWYHLDSALKEKDKLGLVKSRFKEEIAVGVVGHATAGRSRRALDWRVLQTRAYEMARAYNARSVGGLFAAYVALAKAVQRIGRVASKADAQDVEAAKHAMAIDACGKGTAIDVRFSIRMTDPIGLGASSRPERCINTRSSKCYRKYFCNIFKFILIVFSIVLLILLFLSCFIMIIT